jgi:Putative MetA-pathway of phenol degradation
LSTNLDMSKKYTIKTLFLPLLLLFTCPAKAQQTERMETDRPDQTEAVYITKDKYLQVETGLNLEKNDGLTTLIHPTILWKYGLSKKFEFRLITEFASDEASSGTSSGKRYTSGVLPVQIGGKVALFEGKGLLPQTSLLAHLGISKFASKAFQTSKFFPGFRFTMQNSITESIALGYNLGAEWDGETDTPDWIYTFAPGFNLGKKWYGYAELYGSVRKYDSPQHSVAAGFAYYFADNTKIDFSGSYGLSDNATDWYTAIGFSFRFNTKKNK